MDMTVTLSQVLKPQPPLDNKSYPTPTRIAMQREIELNKATKRSASSAFPDAKKTPKKNTKGTGASNQSEYAITSTTSTATRRNKYPTNGRVTRCNTEFVTGQHLWK